MIARISALIEAKKISYQQVADKIGIAQPAFSKMMNGKQNFSIDVIYKLSELLGVSTDFLYGRVSTAPDGWLKIPVLGEVPAGNPIEAREEILNYLAIPAEYKRRVDFGLVVKGDSMIGAGIYSGDIAFVKHQPTAENRQIIVARLGGEVTVKRFLQTPGGIILKPENYDFEPILVSKPDELAIIGIVTGLWRDEVK